MEKAVAIHETVILRLHGGFATRGQGRLYQLIALGAALAGKAEQSFYLRGGVTQLLARRKEGFEEFLAQQHDVRLGADDHGSSVVVSELRIEFKAQLGKKIPLTP